MAKKKIRELPLPGLPPLRVTEVKFKPKNEDWNEYELEDGSIVRVKNTVVRMFLQVDSKGKPTLNELGDPNVVIVGNQIIVVNQKE